MTGKARSFNWPDDVPSADADLTKEQWREFYLLAQEQLDYICQRMNLPPGNIGDLAVEEYESLLERAYSWDSKDSPPNR